MANNIILHNFPKRVVNNILNHVQRRHMPVNVPPTATGKRRFRHAVETDPHKLVNYCCGLNYHIDEPMVQLKPESEYPEWLWKLRLGPKPNSWELEKGTKEYYLKLAEEGRSRDILFNRKADMPSKVVGQHLLDKLEYTEHIRFAALAHMEDDAGFDSNSMQEDWLKLEKIQTKARRYYLPKEENQVIYMDKIPGNRYLKNWHYEEDTSFIKPRKNVDKPPPRVTPAYQDSKRRHRHASN